MIITAEQWSKRWPNFAPEEMACRSGALFPINYNTIEFLDRLQALRFEMPFPFPISSAYRTPEHNRSIGGGKHSAHLEGRAVDIQVYGARAFMIVAAARNYGFTGIGVHQKGDDYAERFIHLDDVENSVARPRPAIWSY